jgi:hypothetical protein
MIKVIITLLLITSAKVLFAQGIVQNKISILYRGFENKVELGSANGDSTLRLEGENVTIEKNFNYWIVKPVQGMRSAKLFAINKFGDTLNSQVYSIRNLPTTVLNLGQFEDGQNITNLQDRKLVVKMPYQCMIQPETKINDWNLQIEDNETFTGKGDFLSDDVIKKMSNLKNGTLIKIKCNYIMNGMTKTKSAAFTLNLTK